MKSLNTLVNKLKKLNTLILDKKLRGITLSLSTLNDLTKNDVYMVSGIRFKIDNNLLHNTYKFTHLDDYTELDSIECIKIKDFNHLVREAQKITEREKQEVILVMTKQTSVKLTPKRMSRIEINTNTELLFPDNIVYVIPKDKICKYIPVIKNNPAKNNMWVDDSGNYSWMFIW